MNIIEQSLHIPIFVPLNDDMEIISLQNVIIMLFIQDKCKKFPKKNENITLDMNGLCYQPKHFLQSFDPLILLLPLFLLKKTVKKTPQKQKKKKSV